MPVSENENEDENSANDNYEDEVTEETPIVQKIKNGEAAGCCPAFYVYTLTFFAALGGFLFGYDTGVISGALLPLKREFQLNELWRELVVSITVGAAILGAVSAGWISDKFGRKPVLVVASCVFAAGSIVMAVAKNKEILLVGRALVGIAIGYASCTVPVYVAEAAPSSIRGRLVTINQLFITFGQFFASVVDGFFSKNKSHGWRYMLGIAGIPASIMLIGMLFMPESPRWLVSKGRLKDAEKMLIKLRGEKNVKQELDGIVNSWSADASEPTVGGFGVLWRVLNTSYTRRALVVGCGLQAIQQLCGINTVMYYSATIISLAGVKDEETAIWLAAVVAAGNFVFTLIALFLVEKAGRLKLTLSSLFGVIVALCLLASTFILIKAESPRAVFKISNDTCGAYSSCYTCVKDPHCGFCYGVENSKYFNGSCLSYKSSGVRPETCVNAKWTPDVCPTSYAWLAVLSMIFYLAMFAPGMGPMPWAINAEIYPLWARSVGNSCSAATNWFFNLLISITFLHLVSWVTEQGAFFLYAAIAGVGWLFLFLLLPETRGKKLEEVEDLFKGPLVARCRKDVE